MTYLNKYISSFWEMTVLMHIYIIIGLIAAGIIKEFISDEYIRKNLGGRGLWPSVKAALLGLPLPLCSCSVIPLAASLRKSGAGKGAVASFFISTPMTGVDSIIATYGVFGWVITLFRVVSASLAAIFAGYFTDRLTGDDFAEPAAETSCSCCGSCCGEEKPVKKSIAARVKSIFKYSFGELLEDLSYPLLGGLLMAALITLFITPDMTGGRTGAAVGYLIAFAAGIPLYVCSVSAIPVAMSLLLAGFTPGAAFVFLAAAPATNVIALNVVRNMLGERGLLIYLISIIFFTLACALWVDSIYQHSGLSFASFTGEAEGGGPFSTFTASAFLLVITAITFKQKILRK